MRKKEKTPVQATDFVLPVVMGTGIALIGILLLILLLAVLIWGGAMPPESPTILLSLCGGVSAFVGARFAIQKGRGTPFLTGALTAVALCLVMVVICLAGTGQAVFQSQLAGTMLMILAGGGFAGLLGKKKKKRKK